MYAEHVAILVPCYLMAAQFVLVDTTYHLRGCHLRGLLCQQAWERRKRGGEGVQLYNYYVKTQDYNQLVPSPYHLP